MLSDKIRADCAEILLDTIVQQTTTAIHMEWKKRKNSAYPCQLSINMHIYQPMWKGLQKKIQILSFTTARKKKSEDDFDTGNSTKDLSMTNNSSR